MSQSVTHKDLARKLKISETTIKSYRRKFGDCIPVASTGKPIRFAPEAVAVCGRIRDLFDLGMSVEEVRARLAQEFPWISLVAKEEPESGPAVAGLPQEFTIAISNMAKSMVTVQQQQKTIMDRMDKMETSLAENMAIAAMPQEGAMKAADFKAVLEDLQGYLRNALMPLQQLQRLNEVQSVTEVLHQAANSMVDAANIMRSLAKSH
ncbi:helix-turn-helix domain-containing protein, partial [Desulfovibrio sp. OttesenSCG-928-O18]|nr:helix-turn-helix domain-containing protein [Desulfovibrio sp. OttesenSCG-928-O18]